MKRRGFLSQLTIGGGILATATLPYGLARLLSPVVNAEPSHRRLRPPGALSNETAFIEACIGCGLCGEVCPPRCIQFYTRDGGDNVNTPYINPEMKACILCGKCMGACPTEALTLIPREEVNMGIAQIDRTACYPWVDRGICGACVSVCPLGTTAIDYKMWGQYQPYVKQGCVGCGMCVEACPHPSLPIRIVERSEGTVMTHNV